ncbi:PASTA domain-containing protein [bacterium]|nr:PASTA domain-containing protein [bacterium]
MKKFSIISIFVAAGLVLAAGSAAQEQRVQQIAGKVVPDLTGIAEDDAVTVCTILALPLEKAFITASDDGYRGKEGMVVRQTPAAGARVYSGQTVTIYLYSPVQEPRTLDDPGAWTAAVSTVDLTWNDDRPTFVLPPGRQPILVATLVNGGTGSIPANRVEWQLTLVDIAGETIYDKKDRRTLALDGGEEQVINVQNIPLETYKATDMIRLVVNPDRTVPETDYDNNIVEQKNLPDLAITGMTVDDLGSRYRFSASVQNIGTRPLQGNFSYTWTLNDEQKPSAMIAMAVGGITLTYEVVKTSIPAGLTLFPITLHVNDGLAGSRGTVWEELDYENNVLEAELELE